MITIDGEAFVDMDEVSKMMDIAKITLQVRVRAKEAPAPIKLKSRVFWKKSDIEAYLESMKK